MVHSISILGSTGSIGRQTVAVAEHLGLNVRALTTNRNIQLAEEQARRLHPAFVAVTDEASAKALRIALADTDIAVGGGENALCEAAVISDTDAVVTAVSGAVGLRPTLAAIEKGRRIALANKETLVCAGDILFFGIQCDNPLQFVLAGWVASLVFSNIVYTLTVSFGDIGKALAVVLLVMQVGGSGGTFPIEMTGPVFQAIYPFLPFTHGINAMHAAMAGAYHMEYWVELGILASYLIPSLALGVVFRRPVIKANDWIIEKLESTKLI